MDRRAAAGSPVIYNWTALMRFDYLQSDAESKIIILKIVPTVRWSEAIFIIFYLIG